MQSVSYKKQSFKTVYDDILGMVNREGVRCLWKGLVPTLWRDVPFSALYWLGYEKMKETLKKRTLNLNEFSASFICGLSAGGFAAFITTPFDVAKTHRQVLERRKLTDSLGHRINGSTTQLMREIFLSQGTRGLFKGKTSVQHAVIHFNNLCLFSRSDRQIVQGGARLCNHDIYL